MQPRQVNVKRAGENRWAALLPYSNALPAACRGAQSIQRKPVAHLYLVARFLRGAPDKATRGAL